MGRPAAVDRRLARLRREIEFELAAGCRQRRLSRDETQMLLVRAFCWTSIWQLTVFVLLPLPRLLP